MFQFWRDDVARRRRRSSIHWHSARRSRTFSDACFRRIRWIFRRNDSFLGWMGWISMMMLMMRVDVEGSRWMWWTKGWRRSVMKRWWPVVTPTFRIKSATTSTSITSVTTRISVVLYPVSLTIRKKGATYCLIWPLRPVVIYGSWGMVARVSSFSECQWNVIIRDVRSTLVRKVTSRSRRGRRTNWRSGNRGIVSIRVSKYKLELLNVFYKDYLLPSGKYPDMLMKGSAVMCSYYYYSYSWAH